MSAPDHLPAEPMAPVDCAWLRMDGARNLMVINGVMEFDRPLERETVREMLARRLVAVRRFRERPVERSRRCWDWQEVPEVDVDAHLVEERLPAGQEALEALVAREMSTPLPLDRPLWRVHLVHREGEGAALLWRLHHSLGDGIALMVLLLAISDLEPHPSDQGTGPFGNDNPLADLFDRDDPLSPEEAREHLDALLPEGSKLLARPAEMLAAANRWLLRAGMLPTFARLAVLPPDRRTRFKRRMEGSKRVSWSRALPLERLHALRAAAGVTVNDALMAAVAGGLRRYLAAHGEKTRGLSLRALVPVNLRPPGEMGSLGNQFGLVFLPLPLGIAGSSERLAALRRSMRKLKHSLVPVVVLAVLRLLGRSPRGLQTLVLRIFGAKASLVLTSVPGPARTLYMMGQAIRSIVFWVPQSAGVGVGISIMTYAGMVRIGVMGDNGVMPDPAAAVAAIEAELEALEEGFVPASAPAAAS